MSAGEWAAFGAGVTGTVIGAAVILGFLYRNIIRPLHTLIARELTPNGGNSIKDVVTRLDTKITENTRITTSINNSLHAHMHDTQLHREITEEGKDG